MIPLWLITPHGFYSAVQHDNDPNLIVVRTRVKADALYLAQFVLDVDALEAESPEDLLVTYDFSDYPWRVILFRDTWQSFLATEAHGDHLNYGNVKDAVKAQQGPARAATYMSVWSALLRLQDQDPDRVRRNAWQGILARHWDDDLEPLASVQDEIDNEDGIDPDDNDYRWTVTLECGCRVDMDDETLEEPCRAHTAPPF